MDNRTNNDVQNTTHKTKEQGTRTPLKIGGEHRCFGWVSSSCSTSGTRRVTNPMISNCCSCHGPVYMEVRFTFIYVLTLMCTSSMPTCGWMGYIQFYISLSVISTPNYKNKQRKILYAIAIVIQIPIDCEWYSLLAVLSFMGIMHYPLSPAEHLF